ncbi:uncharacterized protein F21D5.5 [Ischnura elegans]|uniref:uncharacterized protein F21D5.5 n=1 Tax=Ischnura elegans TaxID=197161 RepID=UPI001ED8B28A|nr:uncharacterized protein F21D5.5 [Ischnura elegans]
MQHSRHLTRYIMESMKRCFLTCVNNTHEPIFLPHLQRITVGRGPETKITDKKCSRIQLSLVADYSKKEVEVQRNGPNPSSVNGQPLSGIGPQSSTMLKNGDIVEIIIGKYAHRINFEKGDGHSKCQSLPESSSAISSHSTTQVQGFECSGSKSAKKRAASPVSTTSPSLETKRPCAPDLKGYFSPFSGGNAVSEVKKSSLSSWKKICDGKVLMYKSAGVVGRDKIAAYDMDGTLITTKSGRVFPKDCDDWQIAFAEVPAKLKELWKIGYKIVIFTNQAGVESGRLRVEDFKSKVNRIVQRLGVPIQLFACIVSSGLYRKPAPGMWSILEEAENDGVPLSKNSKDHMYIGDAAGRGRDDSGASKPGRGAKKPKKDFSCSDRLFALNLELSFFTPEEHFLKRPTETFCLPSFNPKLAVKETKNCSLPNLTSNRKEVVVMVGGPGSGKSYASKNYLKGYARVCRDELGTREKCEMVAREKLSSGLSVVFDCTNPDRSSRSRVVSLAKVTGVPIRCFMMMTTKDQAKHNNKFREITDPSHMKINDMVINSYYSKFEEPTMDEGFEEIVEVKFLPKFDDEKLRKLYSMYLIDK